MKNKKGSQKDDGGKAPEREGCNMPDDLQAWKDLYYMDVGLLQEAFNRELDNVKRLKKELEKCLAPFLN